MLLETARIYLSQNLSVTAVNKSKVSLGSWTELQKRNLTEDEVVYRFSSAHGIAIICGAISGNLEVIDVDTKYDASGKLYETLMQLIPDNIRDRLTISCTRSGGYHLYYRCSEINGNQKLARRPAQVDELYENPHAKVFVLIETRGEGGYVVAPPTEGYQWITGDQTTIPILSSEERRSLLLAARSLNEYLDEPVREPVTSVTSSYSLSPFEDFNERGDVISLLIKHGWKALYDRHGKTYFRRPGKAEGLSGDYWHEKKWFSVFTTSSEFEPQKAYRPAAVFCLLECKNDWSECAKRLSAEGFGKQKKNIDRSIEKIIREGKSSGDTDEEIISALITKKSISNEIAENAIRVFNSNKGETVRKFWEVREQKDGGVKISIIHRDLIEFLYCNGGFQLYFYKPGLYRVIRLVEGLVEDATTEDVKKFVMNYIYSLPENFDGITKHDLLQCIIRGHNQYFSDGLFEFLPRSTVEFIRDCSQIAYFPFRNGLVKITKDNVSLENYKDYKGKAIWKSQMINFDIRISEMQPFFAPGRCEFEQFLYRVNGGNVQRLQACSTIIGYMLHKYKDPTKSFAVILAEESDNEANGGGTGKGIFIHAIAKLLPTQQIDGKTFKADKNFAWQRCNLDTRLIAIQDVRQKLDFESFYSVITEGITVERKSKDEIFIPYQDSPKIVFTTNYSIPAEGNHAKRRQKVIPFSGYFHPGFSPLEEFGHRMFDEWTPDEWNKFYIYLFNSVSAFLEVGALDVCEPVSMRWKAHRLTYGDEFKEWFEDFSIRPENWYPLKELRSEFLSLYGIDEKYYHTRRFKRAIQSGCEINGYEFKSEVQRSIGNCLAIKIIKCN